MKLIQRFASTRTTRMPALWGYPRHLMIIHTIESYWIPSQKRQSQSCKFKEFSKISNFLILLETLHATHILKLLDNICKYKMDPMSIVEDTERTRFCPQTDRRSRWNQYNPLSTLLKRVGGIMRQPYWFRRREELGDGEWHPLSSVISVNLITTHIQHLFLSPLVYALKVCLLSNCPFPFVPHNPDINTT